MDQKFFAFIILLVLSALTYYANSKQPTPTTILPQDKMFGVIDITKENWEHYLDGSRPTLVLFYSPSCQFSKNFAPVYAELGKLIAASLHRESIYITKVHFYEFYALSAKFSVRNVPTLLLFEKGKKDPYKFVE